MTFSTISNQLISASTEAVVLHTLDESPPVNQFSFLESVDENPEITASETNEWPKELIPFAWYSWDCVSSEESCSASVTLDQEFKFPADDSAFDCSVKGLRNGPAPPLTQIKFILTILKKSVMCRSIADQANGTSQAFSFTQPARLTW